MTIDDRELPRLVQVASGREWRGGQHQVFLLARELTQRAIAPVICTGRSTELARRAMDAQIQLETLSWRAPLDPRAVAGLWRLTRPGDMVHAHDSHAHIVADFVSRWRRLTVVVTRRTDRPIRHPARYQRASAVIALSASIRDHLVRAGVSSSRIHRVPPAIDLAMLPPTSNVELSRDLASPLVVCVAALTREKGVDVLVDAAALTHATHPEVRWLVVGDGAERTALEAQRDRLGMQRVVEFAGNTMTPIDALRRAALAVQPSRSEGFGSAAILALGMGVPLIATDVGGLPEALAHGGGVLVPSGDPAELAAAVKRLSRDAGLRHTLSNEGRLAGRAFSVPTMVDRTLDVYRSAMTSRGY